MVYKTAFFLILNLGLIAGTSAQKNEHPIATREIRSHSLPIALYNNIKLDDLNKLVIQSFSEFNFSLLSAENDVDGILKFKFLYPIYKSGKPDNIIFQFKVDGVVANKKCASCSLRWGAIADEKAIGKLPWMVQYDLSSRLYPDMDKAYFSLKSKSNNYIDRQFGFNYKNTWDGERNKFSYNNAYVNVKLPDLKLEITRAFTESGFTVTKDSNAATDAARSVLVFSFPIDTDKPDGVAYAVLFENQFNTDGFCYPCEVSQFYDPHQNLPQMGLSAMSSRLTLASRFESSLDTVYAKLKASTEPYLRSKTQFNRTPKLAPLGSPRPQISPVPVT